MESETHCPKCIDAVVAEPWLLVSGEPRGRDPSWIVGDDGMRHWVRDGVAVCRANGKGTKSQTA